MRWPSRNILICVGLNHADHARESGVAVPKELVTFMKPSSAITGPNDGIVIRRGAKKVDWEVELGVVIASLTKYVTETEALSHVAGYCVINDVSERAFQLEGTEQWVKGKGADTFGPIGLDGNRGRSTGFTGFASLARD